MDAFNDLLRQTTPAFGTAVPEAEVPQRLFHGTPERYGRKILSDGFRVRRDLKQAFHCSLTPDFCTYFTDISGTMALVRAGVFNPMRTERGCVIEIDASALDPRRLRPDEDTYRLAAGEPPEDTRRHSVEWMASNEWTEGFEKRGSLAVVGNVDARITTRAVFID